MKIQLRCDIPVDKEAGMKEGRICEVIEVGKGGRQEAAWWVMGDDGVRVAVYWYEAREVAEPCASQSMHT